MTRPPNILFLLTDQHRPDHLGFGGNPVIRTPNLDALARRSLQFTRAYVANPICMPNRASIFTGRLPSAHGTRLNGIALDWGAQTFARGLRRQGYDTAYFGKCHLQSGNPRNDVQALLQPGRPAVDAFERGHPEGWDCWEDAERHAGERVEMPTDFYGFDHVDLVVGHSDQAGGHYFQWLKDQGVDPASLQGPDKARPYAPLSQQVWRTAMPEELYPTRYIANRTADFLRGRGEREAPFLAVCSFPDPHHPFTPPGRYFDMYDPADIPLPKTFDDPHERSAPHIRRMIANRGVEAGWVQPFAPSEAQYREMAAKEYGMVTMIDDAVGEVLASLEASGLAGDTIVIFTSDHGEMFGDHGLIMKGAMHYDGCIRVPLLIARPGEPGRVSRALASSLDIAPTLLQLAGAPAYYGIQGASLVPVLDDANAVVRDHVLVEEDQFGDPYRTGRGLRMRTLRTESLRLTLYEGFDGGELFDLRDDPDELHNLFDEPSAQPLKAEAMERLARTLMGACDLAPIARAAA